MGVLYFRQERSHAYETQYFRKEHYYKMIADIASMAESPPNILNAEVFRRFGQWLMLNITMFNGNRANSMRNFKNRHVMMKRKATVDLDKDYCTGVAFSREEVLTGDFVVIVVGEDDHREHGKVGPQHFLLPQELFTAMENYSCLKRTCLEGQDDAEKPFFVDAAGMEIKLLNYNNFNIVREMCTIMGVKRLRMTEARHGLAGKQRQMRIEGVTGLDHSVQTQSRTYDDYKTHQATRNKVLVLADTLQTPSKSPIRSGSYAHRERLKKQSEDDTRQVAAAKEEEILSREWEQFISGVTKRSVRHNILSTERFRFFQAIFSWVSLEFSALLLCTPFMQRRTKRFPNFMARFLATDGPGM